MERFLKLFFNIKEIKFRNDDDFVDRLSRRHTTCILLIFSLIITTKQYVGNPIQCWCPAQFTDSHKNYANTICWVTNTYYIPFDDPVPKAQDIDTRDRIKRVSYYQWVPMILLCQAFVCYLPSVLWRFMCRRSGLNVSAVMEAAIAGQRTSYADIRDKTTRYMVHQIDKYLMARMDRRKGCCVRVKQSLAKYCCLVYGKFYGNYLTISYLLTKLIYIGNAVGQLYMMDVFMGNGFHLYGVEVIKRFLTMDDWTFSERFPRVTLCDFQIRHMTMLHRYIVQCVLPINLFNEKIFIFIWFWFALLGILTVWSFLKWAWMLSYWPGHGPYVKRQLRAINALKREKEVVSKFTQKYLKRDGIFMVKLISSNVGNLVAAEVLNGLWDNYGPEHRLLSPDPQGSRSQPRGTVRLNSLAERLDAV